MKIEIDNLIIKENALTSVTSQVKLIAKDLDDNRYQHTELTRFYIETPSMLVLPIEFINMKCKLIIEVEE